MTGVNFLEESLVLSLDFQKLPRIGASGVPLLPVVVQDASTREVLLIAYVNEEALRLSLAEKRAVFYSTSRGEIWRKGDTSGDVLHLEEVRVNCEQNSLLFLVHKSHAGACHTKNAKGEHRATCYYRRVVDGSALQEVNGVF